MIALMQEDTRIDRDEGGKNLSIGYYVMKVLRLQVQKRFRLSTSRQLLIRTREKEGLLDSDNICAQESLLAECLRRMLNE